MLRKKFAPSLEGKGQEGEGPVASPSFATCCYTTATELAERAEAQR
jgi:hypothetical protein